MNRDTWKRQLQERPDRPCGRQHRQLDALLALADQLDATTGKGNVSVLELAKAAGVSERTAKRAITWARTAGLLKQTSRGHRLGDGTAAASGWLLLGESEPQRANPSPQSASPASQSANSRPQRANSAKVAKPGRRTKAGGTYMPPPASEVLAHREHCRDCGFELDPVLTAMGAQVHPGCTDPGKETP